MIRLRKIFASAMAAGVLLFGTHLFRTAHAQETGSKGLASTRIYYEPPNSLQLKMELFHTSATPLTNRSGKVLMKDVKINEYAVSGGEPQLVAEAPECVFDIKTHDAESDGKLHVRGQDGKYSLDGTGFVFHEIGSSLTITNGVDSFFKQPPTNGEPPSLTEISARFAAFQMRSPINDGSAIYRDGVRVVDPKMKLTCELLTAAMPRDSAGTSNQLNKIIAEMNVIIDYTNETGEKIHSTSRKAIYDSAPADGTTNVTIELTGDPRVELTNGWMTADRFFLNQTAHKLQARGNVHLHYFAQNVATSSARTNSPDTEVYCESFDYDLNNRDVQLADKVRIDGDKYKLTASFVTGNLSKDKTASSKPFEHMLAETNVAIDFEDPGSHEKFHATGQRVDYEFHVVGTITNETATLTGNPAVQISRPEGWMTADTIKVDNANGLLFGIGNQHSVFKSQPGESVGLDTEIFSDRVEYSSVTGLCIYHDNVRAYDPELNIAGDNATLKIVQDSRTHTNTIESAKANGNVVADFIVKPFAPEDLTNHLSMIVQRLNNPDETDEVARFVSPMLSAQTKKMLAGYDDGTNVNELPRALADDLNRIVRTTATYSAARFSNVFLSVDTTARLHSQPLGIDLVELNRLLLLDAFRGQIAQNVNGEIIHATGDHMNFLQPTATNPKSLIELTGHPRLERSDGWVSADETIIADRVTGKWWGIGHPRLHMQVENLTKTKSTDTKPAH